MSALSQEERTKISLVYSELLYLVGPALNVGGTFELTLTDGKPSLDLNTQAKSECILKAEGDGIVAYRRYGRRDVVRDFDHLLNIVWECGHGRSYFSSVWLQVFEDFGLEDPRGDM